MTTAAPWSPPNEGDAGLSSDGQALVNVRQVKPIADAVAGKGVRYGCAVTVNTGTIGAADTLQVAAGLIGDGDGLDVFVTADTTVSITTAETAPDDRVDLVVVDADDGIVSVLSGSAEAAEYVAGTSGPGHPAAADDKIILAAIWVEAGDTAIVAADITDLRCYVSATTGRINALSPGTGIKGDGATDDSTSMGTALTAGGSWWFPAATYLCDGNVLADTDEASSISDSLDVLCDPRAVFKAGVDLDADMVTIRHENAFSYRKKFSWRGGQFDMSDALNSTTTNFERYGEHDEGTSATLVALELRTGWYSSALIEDVVFTAVGGAGAGATAAMPGKANHWFEAGGDSAIVWNGEGPCTIRGCTFQAFRDAAIYAQGATTSGGKGTADSINGSVLLVDGNAFYWCASGVKFSADIADARCVDNIFYGCARAMNCTDNTGNQSPVRCTFDGNEVRFYWRGIEVESGTYGGGASDAVDKTVIRNNRFLDGGHVGPDGDSRWENEIITIESASAGSSITDVTINAVSILTGGGDNVDFDTNVETTARALADSINGYRGTSGCYAAVREDPDTAGQWEVIVSQANPAGVLAVTTSGTITVTVDDSGTMSAADPFTQPIAIVVNGATDTVIENNTIIGAEADWAANRSAADQPKAFEITSMNHASGDVLTVDTIIRDTYIDDIGFCGGELTTAGVTDPDRTRVIGLLMGDAMTNHDGFDLLGAASWVDYQDRQIWAPASDVAITSDTPATVATFQLKADAVYRVSGHIVIDGDDTADIELSWGTPPTNTGFWSLIGPVEGDATPVDARGAYGAYTFSEEGGFAADVGLEIAAKLEGVIAPTADGDLVCEASWITADTGTDNLKVGTYVIVERVG